LTRQPWDDVFDRVRVEKSPDHVYPFRPTDADLDAAEAELGCRLPASYRAFALRFGLWGELGGHVRLLPFVVDRRRMGYLVAEAITVVSHSRAWRDSFAFDPAAYARLDGGFKEKLVVFADDLGDDAYAFHPGKVLARRPLEYAVYRMVYNEGWQKFTCASFARFVARAPHRAMDPEQTHGRPTYRHICYSLHGAVKRPFLKRDVKAWLAANSNAALNLAHTIRDEQRPDLFPVLGDALEDAGCASEHVLRACRDGNPQADGEWLLAVLLGATGGK
jgi:hypothetical protein